MTINGLTLVRDADDLDRQIVREFDAGAWKGRACTAQGAALTLCTTESRARARLLKLEQDGVLTSTRSPRGRRLWSKIG